MSERHVPDVLYFRDFSPVVRKQIEEVAPPPAHPVVAAIVALQRPEARLDLNLIVHEREYRIEITALKISYINKVRSTFSRDILERSIA